MDILTDEVWKDIPGFPGFMASSLGRIKKLGRESITKEMGVRRTNQIKDKILRQSISKGYFRVSMNDRQSSVHRTIALAFHGKPDCRMEINHKDGNPENNRPDNLEWVTHQENVSHSRKNGLIPKTFSRRKLTREQAIEIKTSKEANAVLASRFGIRYEMVQRIKNGRAWKCLVGITQEKKMKSVLFVMALLAMATTGLAQDCPNGRCPTSRGVRVSTPRVGVSVARSSVVVRQRRGLPILRRFGRR